MFDIKRLSLQETRHEILKITAEIDSIRYRNECSELILKYLLELYFKRKKQR